MDAKKAVISIGRQTGSGGRLIGRKVAEALGVPFYDKELLARAAKESGFCEEIFEEHDEKPTRSFLYSLAMEGLSFGYAGPLGGDMPMDHKLFVAQFNTIKKIAQEGSCVIVGRCADYALSENPNLLSVFIHGETEDRVERLRRQHGILESKAREMLQKTDKKRSSYYNYYTDKKWGSAISYDLCLSSSAFGIEGCVKAILGAVDAKGAGKRALS